jgi:hypothetical protein
MNPDMALFGKCVQRAARISRNSYYTPVGNFRTLYREERMLRLEVVRREKSKSNAERGGS